MLPILALCLLCTNLASEELDNGKKCHTPKITFSRNTKQNVNISQFTEVIIILAN